MIGKVWISIKSDICKLDGYCLYTIKVVSDFVGVS